MSGKKIGELLVYDECETREGKYDELGTGRGISAFGTIFWLRTSEDGSPSRYSRRDARRRTLAGLPAVGLHLA